MEKTEVHSDSEYIVISRTWLIAAAIGLTTFLIGGVLGYVLALTTYQRGLDDAVAAVNEAVADLPAGSAAAAAEATATPLPARLDDVSVDDDPVLGPEDAPITIVEFSDFHCPYCSRFQQETLPSLLEQYGDQVRLVYRDFPVVGGASSAVAAECANEQGGFWEYHDALFANLRGYTTMEQYVALADSLGLDGAALQECIESGRMNDEIQNDYNDGRAYGVSGTPTFFVNGVRVIGAQPLENFVSIIDAELNQ
jgi:protein-disulfide isomerase